MIESLVISMDDCIKAGHCAKGVRRWFNAQGLDFRAFMASGIPAVMMVDTGDGQGISVVLRTIERRLAGDPDAIYRACEEVRARHG